MSSQRIDGTATRAARAFDAAFMRFCEADTVEGQEDETSNLLHHLYRLAVAVHGEPENGVGGWSVLESVEGMELIPALIQLRHVDVHGLVKTTEMRDVYPEFYTQLYGTLVWDLSEDSFVNQRQRKGAARYNVVEILNNSDVLSTLHRARRALA